MRVIINPHVAAMQIGKRQKIALHNCKRLLKSLPNLSVTSAIIHLRNVSLCDLVYYFLRLDIHLDVVKITEIL